VSTPFRIALLVLPLAGAGLLVAAQLSTLYEVVVVTAVPEGGSFSAGGHHGYALGVMAVGIAVMALGAVLGGSRPAAFAVLVLAAAALAIALAFDLPDVDEGSPARTSWPRRSRAPASTWRSPAAAPRSSAAR
jgi:hypothetical protein